MTTEIKARTILFVAWLVCALIIIVDIIGALAEVYEDTKPVLIQKAKEVRTWWYESLQWRSDLISEWKLAEWEV